MTAVELATKVCTGCGEEKPLSEFSRNRRAPDGRLWECKNCNNERVKENQRRLRSEMGEEYYLAYQARIVAKYRSTPEGRRKSRLHGKARGRALSRLAEAHRKEYEALLRVTRHELGLDP